MKVLLVLVVLMLWIFRGKKRLMPWCLDNLFELGVVRIPLCAKKRKKMKAGFLYVRGVCVACQAEKIGLLLCAVLCGGV